RESPLPASHALIKGILVALKVHYLVAGLIVMSFELVVCGKPHKLFLILSFSGAGQGEGIKKRERSEHTQLKTNNSKLKTHH
ncbi:MAG: hypothetical protein KZQ99_12405, partial [Candidatus Thiodiazotropha sp. (ex Dulcina madagascariensis)]|nr:hypothetical protein [Candidatus Thiodiazotropha sp. (ex Dulcina madagascariensis)]